MSAQFETALTPAQITLIEVGPRDGLQNESKTVSVFDRLSWIRELYRAGLKNIEIGAFVREDKVPAMAGTDQVLSGLAMPSPVDLIPWVLVPNKKGLDQAIAAKATHIALFSAVTDGFNVSNTGKTVQQSFDLFKELIPEARAAGMRVRGYLSTVFGCPFEGRVAQVSALKVIEQFLGLGFDEVSLGDTIGVAVPPRVDSLFKEVLRIAGKTPIAGHFHNTRGTALANVFAGLNRGVTRFDTSASGLGGCPYAPSATGNLATEDLVFACKEAGIRTGVDYEALCRASAAFIEAQFNRAPESQALRAFVAKKGKLTTWEKNFP